MATNKNASIRYRALDKCFRDFHHRYFIEDLIEKCEEELESFNFTANVSRRQIFDDIRFMESFAGWTIPLDRLKDGKKTYYRYSDRNFSINKQPLNDEEAQQLKTMIITLDSPEDNIKYEYAGNPLRKVLEHLFWTALKYGLLPEECTEEEKGKKRIEDLNELADSRIQYWFD